METQFTSLREKIAAESKARRERYAQFRAVYDRAYAAGLAAGNNAIPTPMVVTDAMHGKQWYVEDGACGFAWIRVRPATSSFARWLLKEKIVSGRSYNGGVDIWISDHNQSVTRKEAHARAMADVLRSELGINCYADSRLD